MSHALSVSFFPVSAGRLPIVYTVLSLSLCTSSTGGCAGGWLPPRAPYVAAAGSQAQESACKENELHRPPHPCSDSTLPCSTSGPRPDRPFKPCYSFPTLKQRMQQICQRKYSDDSGNVAIGLVRTSRSEGSLRRAQRTIDEAALTSAARKASVTERQSR